MEKLLKYFSYKMILRQPGGNRKVLFSRQVWRCAFGRAGFLEEYCTTEEIGRTLRTFGFFKGLDVPEEAYLPCLYTVG